jgi:hypothetical protein
MTTSNNNRMNIILDHYDILLDIYTEPLCTQLLKDLNILIFDIKMLMIEFSNNEPKINEIYDRMLAIINHVKHWSSTPNIIIGSTKCKWKKGKGFSVLQS